MGVTLVGGRSDSVANVLRVSGCYSSVDSANGMVFDQLLCCHPTKALYHIGYILVALPSTDHAGAKVDDLLKAVGLGNVTRTVYR